MFRIQKRKRTNVPAVVREPAGNKERGLMKKIMTGILWIALLLSLSACGGSSDGEPAAEEETTQTVLSEETEEAKNMTENSTGMAEVGTEDSEERVTTDTAEEEETMTELRITAGGQSFTAALNDTEAAREFVKQLPMTVTMQELNGNEKYFYLPESLSTDAERPDKIQSGDLMLFGSDCLVLFYETFSTSYSYTPLGQINNAEGLAEAVGSGSVEVTFEMQ